MTRIETFNFCDCDFLRESRDALLREIKSLRESLRDERLSREPVLGSVTREAAGMDPEAEPVMTGVGSGSANLREVR